LKRNWHELVGALGFKRSSFRNGVESRIGGLISILVEAMLVFGEINVSNVSIPKQILRKREASFVNWS